MYRYFAFSPEQSLFSHTNVADFFIENDKIECICPAENLEMAGYSFLSSIISLWLEQHNRLVIHASVIAFENCSGAVAFSGHSTAGKSTIAAASLMAGNALISDDLLVITEDTSSFIVQPGFPAMNLSDEQLIQLHGSTEGFDTFLPGGQKRRVPIGPGGLGMFSPNPLPIQALFLPERQPADERKINIQRLSARQAVIELLRYSFVARLASELGLASSRLARISRMAQTVPVYQLSYPTGFANLPLVIDQIITHLSFQNNKNQ